MENNLLELAESSGDVLIFDENGKPLETNDEEKRFFERPWIFKIYDT